MVCTSLYTKLSCFFMLSQTALSLLPSRPALKDCYKNSLMAQRLVLLPHSTTVLGLGLET